MEETLFYVFGIALVLSAVALSAMGLRSERFPASRVLLLASSPTLRGSWAQRPRSRCSTPARSSAIETLSTPRPPKRHLPPRSRPPRRVAAQRPALPPRLRRGADRPSR